LQCGELNVCSIFVGSTRADAGYWAGDLIIPGDRLPLLSSSPTVTFPA